MMDDTGRLQTRALAILIAAAVLLAGGLLWGQIVGRVQANLWNVSFVKAVVNGAELPEPLPKPSWWQQVWLGRAALEWDDLPAAREAFASLESKSEPFVLAAQAELAAAEGDISRAIEIWSAQGNYQALSRAAEKAEQAGNFNLSEAWYRAGYPLAPTETILKLAPLYTDKLRQPEKAIPYLQQTITSFPAHERWPVWQRLLGDACRQVKDWECAEQAYTRALVVTPDDVLSLVGMGYVARDSRDDPDTALDYFSQAIQRQPGQYEGYLALAETYSTLGEWSNADAAYLQAINARPDLVGLYIARAKGAARNGNLELSRQIFKGAQALFPESDILSYEYAALEYGAGNLTTARQLIEHAIQRMRPPQPWYYRLAGIIYSGLQDQNAAKYILEQGLALFPGESSLYIELAIVEKNLAHPEQAIQAVEQALALTGQPDAGYLARAGVIYEWVGDNSRALDYYRQALAIDPADPVALPGFERLNGR